MAKINVTESGLINLENVYNPIRLETSDGEVLYIQMRDSGFEMTYYKQEPAQANDVSTIRCVDGSIEHSSMQKRKQKRKKVKVGKG